MKRISKRRYVAMGLALVAAAFLVYALWQTRRPAFTVSPETTHITAPVDSLGLIDYPTALNEKLGEGITPETNANVLIWKALGPHPDGAVMPDAYFEWLGIKLLPEKGNYFVGWEEYAIKHLKEPPAAMKEKYDVATWLQFCLDRHDKTCKSPWKTEEYPEVVAWLQANEPSLALIHEATRREKYFNPLVPKSDDRQEARLITSLLPTVQKNRSVANALKCRAMMKIASGKYQEAWEDLMAVRRLGTLLTQGASIIEALVGYAINAAAIDGQATLIAAHPHSSQQVQAWLKELQALPHPDSVANKFDLGERYLILDSLQSIAAKGMQSFRQATGEEDTASVSIWGRLFPRGVDYDPAFKTMNNYCDRVARVMRETDRPLRKKEAAQITEEFQQLKEKQSPSLLNLLTINRSAIGQQIGNSLLLLLMPTVEKYLEATDRAEQLQQNLLVAYALAAYRADKGSYPARLDDLAPQYLAKIPMDQFSGQPLIYKPTKEGFLLYSVGVNEKDDGGRSPEDEPRGDDLRIRIPIPLRAAKEER